MISEKRTERARALEAALFIYGEPMSFEKIQGLLKIEAHEVPQLVAELKASLQESGLNLIEHEGSVQLTTHSDFAGMVGAIVKEELSEGLTSASLETLSIIAYAGPISRSRIDYVRGVNSSYILRNLLIRGLLDRKPDPSRPNAYLYSVSFEFLRHLGIGTMAELPQFEEYRGLIARAEQKLGAAMSSEGGARSDALGVEEKTEPN